MKPMPDPSPAAVQPQAIDEFFEMAYGLSHLARHRLQNLLGSYGLTPPQYTAMRTIESHANRLSVSALAEAVHQVNPTVTGILNRLEERGLVIRQRSAADRRHQLVSLTVQGKALLEAIGADLRRAMGQFLAGLTPAEREILFETLRSLTTRLAYPPVHDNIEDHALE